MCDACLPNDCDGRVVATCLAVRQQNPDETKSERPFVKQSSLPTSRCARSANVQHRPLSQQETKLRSHLATWVLVESMRVAPKVVEQLGNVRYPEPKIAQSRNAQWVRMPCLNE
jgi:hypothetical protein